MENTVSPPLPSNRTRNTTILSLMALEGIIALAAMFAVPSEAGSARFLGLSPTRLAVALLPWRE
jgi:hypothetical protein